MNLDSLRKDNIFKIRVNALQVDEVDTVERPDVVNGSFYISERLVRQRCGGQGKVYVAMKRFALMGAGAEKVENKGFILKVIFYDINNGVDDILDAFFKLRSQNKSKGLKVQRSESPDFTTFRLYKLHTSAATLSEFDAMPPAEVAQVRDVEPFARRAVGLVGVKADVAVKVNNVGDEPCQIGDGDILAGSDVIERLFRSRR